MVLVEVVEVVEGGGGGRGADGGAGGGGGGGGAGAAARNLSVRTWGWKAHVADQVLHASCSCVSQRQADGTNCCGQIRQEEVQLSHKPEAQTARIISCSERGSC